MYGAQKNPPRTKRNRNLLHMSEIRQQRYINMPAKNV